ncbi:MAG: ABC transporter ATP-binding protein/permease [Clostridia bacterium]|nr:ABC transporter ATP-binding protein/permease [Clostridia bacterium]
MNALRGVSISFRKREFVSILGPSGCGKTTLLNIIGGLDHYTDGDLIIGGRSTKSYKDRDWDVYRNHRVGFIFQSYNLIPPQTVLGNVELALTIAGIGKEERIARAKQALDRVGLSGQYYKKPNQLSGGQCQRVAIARALVNDPEILLADEPTGALDTVTSVQIMELIKEISRERLVIMVTHNPELADQYSTRIVRLLDGLITEDTNPMSEEEEKAELEEEKALLYEENAPSDMTDVDEPTEKAKPKKAEKAKMSFLTAFMLSAKNLISKRGRTAMVGIAGSIGIIGIAMVLAFSAGIKGYVSSMQDDMLSGNPITITENTYDLDALSGMMDAGQKLDIIKEPNRVYINSLIEYLIETRNDMQDFAVKNDLTEDYIEYIKAMPKEYYQAMVLNYGLNLNSNLYTDFKGMEKDGDGKPTDVERELSISAITDLYSSILRETDYAMMSYMIPMLAPNIKQAPSAPDYILSQYDIKAGELADGINENGEYEVMLVLDADDELSDLLLARFGYYSQQEFLDTIDKANAKDPDKYKEESDIYRDSFEYEELLDKTFTYYPNDTVFKKGEPNMFIQHGYSYLPEVNADFEGSDSLKLRVVGIISPKEGVNYGSMRSGIYYTEELTEAVLDMNKDSEFVEYFMNDDHAAQLVVSTYYGLSYSFKYHSYNYDDDGNKTDITEKNGMSIITYSTGMSDMMSSTGSQAPAAATDLRDKLIRNLGGNSLANAVTIYPISFDEKDKVTEYLEAWNEKGDITLGDKTLSFEDRQDVTFTDTLELVINIINTLIDVVSYALIAFTSISLVVSTVMIGIITSVSVVERIKEIGVIRSLGGRKKDVSALFIAETFIIGLLAGLFGVGVTYLISLPVNLLLAPLINYSAIAALPLSQAVLLVLLSVGLTLISGVAPARSAARKDPVVALRTE